VPGSAGEHELQERLGTFKRAAAFYDKQMLDHLNPLMREFLTRQQMVFVATTDGDGGCDCSFRSGPAGFVRALDERTVMYPEFRGNGVMATLGNLVTNPYVGLLFVDFFESTVGLHVNGRARIVEDGAVRAFEGVLERLAGAPLYDPGADALRTPERWVVIEVEEAYIHCSKNIPLLARLDKDAARAGGAEIGAGDFFAAKGSPRPWAVAPPAAPAPVPPADPEPAPSFVLSAPERPLAG
jgi:predicted pyridoxine 5'-phosphate oxidase superfamily flavin-nucleotide-binding protein